MFRRRRNSGGQLEQRKNKRHGKPKAPIESSFQTGAKFNASGRGSSQRRARAGRCKEGPCSGPSLHNRDAVFLAVAALLGVAAARDVPPAFTATNSAHSEVRAVAHQDQRPRFDRDGFEWSVPATAHVSIQMVVGPLRVRPEAQVLSTLPIRDVHHNRPPPIFCLFTHPARHPSI